MIFLILFFIITVFSQKTEFIVLGLSTNTSIIYEPLNMCNFNLCPEVICYALANTTSAYITLYPFEGMTSCPKLAPLFNVKMITFIFNKNKEMLFPFYCNNMGECLMKACSLYLSYKESFLMAFTGQCLM